MRLSKFILASLPRIIGEWEAFARTCSPAADTMDLEQRRDHVAGMLRVIARDLESPQTKREQSEKSKGKDDAGPDSATSATQHGTDRAATGYTPAQMVGEFRALRASVLRLWAEEQSGIERADIDEITRFNEAIDQAVAESIVKYSQEVERSKDLFLGVLGHDLRSPLGAIMMSAASLLRAEGPEWRHARKASLVLKSGERIDALIRDLVDFTRSRLGTGIPLTPVDMDLERVARETVDEVAAIYPSSVVRLDAKGDLHGRWDSDRLAQVLANLIGNACQHGTKNLPVEVTAHGGPDSVVVSVRSKGPTIPESHLKGIFDPFRQLERSKPKDPRSVGLGLYIAQAIVLAHKGTIDVASTVGATTFTVRLPRVAAKAAAA
jgi:signal transduction histidine kinase